MPKHKGTDHLKADLRGKIAKLIREGEKRKQSGRRQNPYLIEREGVAQVMLIGAPNSGKSQLLKTFCPSAQTVVESYPHSTQRPVPGMVIHENVGFQLVDLPPIIHGKMEWWQAELLKVADGAIVVLDLLDSDPLKDLEEIEQGLDQVNIKLLGKTEVKVGIGVKGLPTIVAANKLETLAATERLASDCRAISERFEVIGISAATGKGLGQLATALFQRLQLIRIFTKIPGKEPDMSDPYVLTKGKTILDLAEAIHKEFREKLKFARVWGTTAYGGQKVPKDYILSDGDVVELHV